MSEHTRVLPTTPEGVAEAAGILRAGGLVAFPTETVYGLGALALDADAAARIFEAKGRPANDPLIVHIARVSQLRWVAHSSPWADLLAERFWPGPLTLVLEKQPSVPDVITAGLGTVAVRVPAHSVAQALLEAVSEPIAAPSANLFSHVSPTRAEHVLHDLDGRIDAVLDGGPTPIGVESTIVDVSGTRAVLLRPGGLPAEIIEQVLGRRLEGPPRSASGRPQVAPGLLDTHYAPRTPLVLIVGDSFRCSGVPEDPVPAFREGTSPSPTALGDREAALRRLEAEARAARAAGRRVGLLLNEGVRLPSDLSGQRDVVVERLGAWESPEVSGARLYDALRRLDASGADVLFTLYPADPNQQLGRALADRLRRAATTIIGDAAQ